MKLIGIDIDILKSQADGLRSQLADIETVIRIASNGVSQVPSRPAFIAEAVVAELPAQPRPQIASEPRAPRKMKNIGARKAAVLALHTGPASERELSRALVWSQSTVHEVIDSMEREGYSTRSAGGVLSLTDKGQDAARWFLANPQYQTYSKDRIAAIAKARAARV